MLITCFYLSDSVYKKSHCHLINHFDDVKVHSVAAARHLGLFLSTITVRSAKKYSHFSLLNLPTQRWISSSVQLYNKITAWLHRQ